MRLYAENNTNYIRSLDTGSIIKLQVINNDNTPMDLTIFEKVEVVIGDEYNAILSVVPISIDKHGFLEFNIPSDTLPSGKYYLEVNMAKLNKELYIAPSAGQFIVTVTKSLNDVGKEISIINLQVWLEKIDKAVDTSTQALRNSETAISHSNIAISESEKAVEIVKNNTLLAEGANAKSDEAIAIANNSDEKSNIALSQSETAEGNSVYALNKSDEAISTSIDSNEKSNTALSKATTAEINSSSALNKSNSALSTANNADEKSNVAISTSTTAESKSNEALTKAKEALAFANSAETKSSESLANALNAVTTANNVRKDFDQIIRESGNVDAEVILSRTNVDGVEFDSLKLRLDSMETDIDTKTQQAVSEHSNLKNNPHDVTAEQVGSYTKDEVDTKINTLITNLNWKDSVETFDSIATTYPNPKDGWTVNVNDTDMTYRYTDSEWIAISANSIPLATSENDGKMSKTDKVDLDKHLISKNNPHNVTKAQIGLGVVDNTSDLNKPISNAVQIALDLKADNSLVSIEEDGLMSVEDKVKLDRLASEEKGSLLKGYTYTIQATNNGQTDFQIPLDTFAETDFIMVSQNRTLLESYDFSIVPVASNYYVRLVESVIDYTQTSITLFILKNEASIAIIDAIPVVSNRTHGLMTKEDKEKVDKLYGYIDGKSIQDLIDAHANRLDNPHDVTAEQVGLSNVDNTSDLDKPVSKATQLALDSKADKTTEVIIENLKTTVDLHTSNNEIHVTKDKTDKWDSDIDALQNELNNLITKDNETIYGNEIHGLRINSEGNLEYLNTTDNNWIEIKSGTSNEIVQSIVDTHEMKTNIHTTLEEKEKQIKVVTDVGDVTQLLTDSKILVSAVNELFTSANNGKSSIVTAVGLPSVESDTFTKIAENITKGKTDIATAITNRGITTSATDTLEQFKTNISNIQGGENATALASDILTGKTAIVNKNLVTGTMPNNGARTLTPSTSNQSIPVGYHNGSGYVAGSSNLTAGNIKSGINLFGVTGNFSGGGIIANSSQTISLSSSDYYSSKFTGWYGKSIVVNGVSSKPNHVTFETSGITDTYGNKFSGGGLVLPGQTSTGWVTILPSGHSEGANCYMDNVVHSGTTLSFMLWFGKTPALYTNFNFFFYAFA